MNGRRGRFDSPPDPQTKPNRLSRSFRQTQAVGVGSPRSQQAGFKTPTRTPGPGAAAGFSGESPNNDSDFQQDIIWDATSPPPHRLGKRGKKHTAGVVDISEIVSRIAPKHGRPKVSEPTLQQWIGDSATIPCTPDVQTPKPKKKSPRANGVDDLLKLAKQFDFNMFRRDEDDVEDVHQQSLELLPDNILDLEDGGQNESSPPLPGNYQPAVSAAGRKDVQLHLDRHVEDDLDFLFDGPTQHVSGSFSQASAAQPSQVKTALTLTSAEASGKPSASSRHPTGGVSTTNDEFEDDWENDSLVLEMTQNPQNFTCSTQRAASPGKHHHRAAAALAGAAVRLGQSAGSRVEKGQVRMTFRLESNPRCRPTSGRRSPHWPVDDSSKTAGRDAHWSRFSPETGSQRPSQTCPSNMAKPHKSEFHQRKLSYSAVPAVSDFLDEDLDTFFSSDPVWDDPTDDDLLCEMCEDVENQIQSGSNVSTKHLMGQGSDQRAALQPTNRILQPPPQKRPTVPPCPGGPGCSLAGGPVCRGRVQAQQRPPQQHGNDHFTFKRPNKPVSTVTNGAESKCSAAEIELKKQQAMARRRQRLQADQNLRAST